MTTQSSHPGIAQQLDPSHITQTEFVTAMVHLHRGELSEATAWRSRMDTTTNWAVVFSVTTLSFVFADKSSERHVLIPIVSVFCTFLLLMEARRYRVLRYLALTRPDDRDQFLSPDARRLRNGDAGLGRDARP